MGVERRGDLYDFVVGCVVGRLEFDSYRFAVDDLWRLDKQHSRRQHYNVARLRLHFDIGRIEHVDDQRRFFEHVNHHRRHHVHLVR
ncbi:MAG: hypothetical protein WEB67_08155 [Acidimicrobiia bacterium]